MKKYIYTLVIIFIFVFTPKVYAIQNNGLFSEYTIASVGNFWSLNSTTTQSSAGYNLLSFNDGVLDYAYAVPNNTFTLGTNGAGLTQCGLPLLSSNYYSITYAFVTTSEYIHQFYTNRTDHLAQSYSQNLFGTAFNYSNVSNSIHQYNSLIYFPIGSDIGTFTVLFKPINNQDCLTVLFSSNNHNLSSTNLGFLGYKLTNLGSVAPTTTEIKNALSSDFNALNSAISNVNSNITNSKNDIISNQNANAQQAHQDALNTQNTIKDDTVNSNTGKSFFDNFSDNTHGLSGIITAPLNIIQRLINVNPTSCSALSTTYHNKTISMECGQIFWGHTGFSEFNVFYNMVVGGAFCYLIIKDLFLTIEKLKDPDNDKVEVMDL